MREDNIKGNIWTMSCKIHKILLYTKGDHMVNLISHLIPFLSIPLISPFNFPLPHTTIHFSASLCPALKSIDWIIWPSLVAGWLLVEFGQSKTSARDQRAGRERSWSIYSLSSPWFSTVVWQWLQSSLPIAPTYGLLAHGSSSHRAIVTVFHPLGPLGL